ncbi:TrbI/VirB10 family protein [Brevundimonas sp.]|uniref:TrbI/VirB10 family protein n=1 Tax=Brevundimonas sp. TaxID=1871086 RepID=UPI0035B43D08
MTGAPTGIRAEAKEAPVKTPPPDLSLRAPPPPATRLRKSVVRVIVIGGVVLLSGSLAWAFVVQPDLRAAARLRAAEAHDDPSRGPVRPAEAVTDQPATYDRLPEPRGRPESGTGDGSDAPSAPASPAPQPRRAADSTPSSRQLAARSALFFEDDRDVAAPAALSVAPEKRADLADLGAMYSGHALVAPLSPYEVKAGAIIPAVLLTGVDTERAGPVVATVSQDVFDTVSGRHLVVPQGARLIGRHEGESAYGERRAFLVWDRLILPNGKSLLLGEEPGVDAQGAVGVRGRVDRRLLPLVIGTAFAGAITTLGQVARNEERGGGLVGDAGDAAAIEGAQVGGRLVDRELQVRPSIRLRPGAQVRVMISRDLILEPYR